MSHFTTLQLQLHVEVSLSKILNPKIAPDVQLAPCVAASAISKGPAMSWRLIQGAPWPSPIGLAEIDPSNPRDPLINPVGSRVANTKQISNETCNAKKKKNPFMPEMSQ